MAKICRFSSIIKTRGIRLSFEKKQKLREDLKRVKEMSRAIKEGRRAEKEAKKQRRRDNIKRAEENRKKSEIVQVVSNAYFFKKLWHTIVYKCVQLSFLDNKHCENKKNEKETFEND